MKCLSCNKEETFVAPFMMTLRVTLKDGKIASAIAKTSLLARDCHCWLCGSTNLEITDKDKQELFDRALGEF